MRARTAMRTAAVLTVAFWVLLTIGGTANPGYLQYEQYVSSLASPGAVHPWWGIAAMACMAGSLLIVGPALRRWDGFVAGLVTAGGAGLALATAVPITCPPGEDFCLQRGATATADFVHAAAVLVTAACLFLALFAGALHTWRGRAQRRDRLVAVLCAATLLAVTGPRLLALSGLQQRLAILAVQVGLLAAAAAAVGEERRRARQDALRSARRPPGV